MRSRFAVMHKISVSMMTHHAIVGEAISGIIISIGAKRISRFGMDVVVNCLDGLLPSGENAKVTRHKTYCVVAELKRQGRHFESGIACQGGGLDNC